MDTLQTALNWSMAASAAFKASCESDLHELGIDFFHFVRIDKQGQRTMLCTHPQWLDHCVTQQLLNTPVVLMLNEQLPTGEYAWHTLDQHDPILQQGRDFLGLNSGLSIIIRQAQVSYGYHFGEMQHRDHLNPWQQEQCQALYRFILRLHDQAEQLLAEAYLHPWLIVSDSSPLPWLAPKDMDTAHSASIRVHNKRWLLPWQDNALQLSTREMECLAGLMQGLTAKQIAKHLGISHRTVQVHWERTRMKAGSCSRHDLVVTMRKSGLTHLIVPRLAEARLG